MKEQKLLIVDGSNAVNEWLEKGWEIISVTPQRVSNGASSFLRGKFAIVIQKQK